MRGKKGIELSVNFIVVIILGLVIFGFGLKFAYDAFYKAQQLQSQSVDDLNRKMEEVACDNAQMVCVGDNSKKVTMGDAAYFTVVVFNVEDGSSTFSLEVKFDKAYDSSQNPISSITESNFPQGSILNPQSSFDLSTNQKQTRVIGVIMDKDITNLQKGTYVFTLTVTRGNEEYGPKKKLYVQVI